MTNEHYKPNALSRFYVETLAPAVLSVTRFLGRRYLWVVYAIALMLAPVWVELLLAIRENFLNLADTDTEDWTPQQRTSLYFAIGASVAALTALAAVPLALVRAWLNERNAKASEEQAETAKRQFDIAQRNSVSESFTKAIDQLGAVKTVYRDDKPVVEANIEVRLGAIYALERIAQDSLRDHIPIMETLCAYVRQNANPDPPRDLPDEAKDRETIRAFFGEPRPLRADVQAVFEVVKRRSPAQKEWEDRQDPAFRLDLRRANLQGLDLSEVDLTKANLSHARLEGAHLRLARLDEAVLSFAKLQGVNLIDVKLEGANLFRSNLEGAKLIEANLNGAELTGARLEGANLSGASLKGADLSETELYLTDLSHFCIDRAKLRGADFSGANNINWSSLASAFGVCSDIYKTILPEDWNMPDHWHKNENDVFDPKGLFEEDYEAWIAAGCPTEADWREKRDKA